MSSSKQSPDQLGPGLLELPVWRDYTVVKMWYGKKKAVIDYIL